MYTLTNPVGRFKILYSQKVCSINIHTAIGQQKNDGHMHRTKYDRGLTGLSSPSNVSSCVKSSRQSCRLTDDMLRPYRQFTYPAR